MISLLSFLSLKSIIAIAVAVITFIFIYTKKNWIMSLFSKKVTNRITNDINLDTYVSTNVSTNVNTNVSTNTIFAVNDNGNFDLADANGKILNIGFGPNPKIYINLLDQSEKDVEKTEHGFIRKMDTKVYEIGGKPYTVNFTQLT
jgi:hypothetical protein